MQNVLKHMQKLSYFLNYFRLINKVLILSFWDFSTDDVDEKFSFAPISLTRSPLHTLQKIRPCPSYRHADLQSGPASLPPSQRANFISGPKSCAMF